jgi:hypothetical protein
MPEWKKCPEFPSAQDLEAEFLVKSPYDEGFRVAKWRIWGFCDDESQLPLHITHWMEIPKVPTEGDELADWLTDEYNHPAVIHHPATTKRLNRIAEILRRS